MWEGSGERGPDDRPGWAGWTGPAVLEGIWVESVEIKRRVASDPAEELLYREQI